ncbi:MAG: hypothetical protein HC860_17060 [Alkalinema sp. RU_4_3]|nr:hypothetical protein [Alkalinema sp. RU_4_3]
MSVVNGDLVLEGSQWMLAGFPVLGMPDEGRSTKYFSLNPFVPNQENRCPLECAYCVCHQDAGWHQHPERFSAVVPEEDLLGQLLDRILATPKDRQAFRFRCVIILTRLWLCIAIASSRFCRR